MAKFTDLHNYCIFCEFAQITILVKMEKEEKVPTLSANSKVLMFLELFYEHENFYDLAE